MKYGFPEEDPHCRRLIVLAGDQYVQPLQERDVFEPFPWVTRFPFQEQDFGGIGEQMRWLSEEADQAEQRRNDVDGGRQSSVSEYSDAGIELAEDVDGQTEWSDWAPDSG
jgi:hypothetical protein